MVGSCPPVGNVLKSPCRRDDHQCEDKLLKSHKFYLAFENSVCKDYVTEKFFNALETGIVPVVMGK